jgi:HD superfamily phosphohydrolase
LIKRDQIHGDVEFSDAEMKLINSRSFERLRYIKQLGFAEFEFPGATHTRYQHSLGVCKCVTDMYNAVIKNCPEFYREGDLELLRFMALVHDMGHSPFSHASEELSHISHEERLTDILEYEKKNIILAHNYDIESWDLINQVYNGEGLTYMSDTHLIALHSFMDGFIDADKMDYLERDAINCGVSYGRFDRDALVNNLTMIKGDNGIYNIALKQNGVQALESFILARYYMFSQVYMHPEERVLRFQYCDAMKDLLPNGVYPDDVRKFLALDDTKYARKLKFLQDNKYQLIYDGEFDNTIKSLVDKKLGKYLLCDTPRKNIFRKDTDDSTVMVVDDISGRVIPCSDASPILKNIEYTCIHKLRYYAETSQASELKTELIKLLKGVN